MAGERLEQALKKFREKYAPAMDRKQKGRILEEFCGVSGYHRKYGIYLLQPANEPREGVRLRRGVSYSSAAVGVLEKSWQSAGYPRSVRLKAMLPRWLPWAREDLGGVSEEIEKTKRLKKACTGAASLER